MPGNSVGAALWLLFCAAAILVLAWYVTRRIAAGGTGLFGIQAPGGHISLLARLPLGRDQYLAVVRLEQRCLVLGVSPGGVTLLTELSPEEAQGWTVPAGPPPGPDFRSLLRRKKDDREGK